MFQSKALLVHQHCPNFSFLQYHHNAHHLQLPHLPQLPQIPNIPQILCHSFGVLKSEGTDVLQICHPAGVEYNWRLVTG